MGQSEASAATLQDIVSFWLKYKNRWEDCILQKVDYNADVMLRPHIRFNGTDLKENDQRWSHAQNDAIGYFVWLYCKLARQDQLLAPFSSKVMALIALYHYSIGYWKTRTMVTGKKLESWKLLVGCAAAGWKEFEALLNEKPDIKQDFAREHAALVAELDLAKLSFRPQGFL